MPLWQAYLTFYNTELPAEVSESTWQRFLDPAEPTQLAIAWQGDKAVGIVQFIYHRSNWSIGNSCYLQDLFVSPEIRGTGAGRLLIEHVYATARDNHCAIKCARAWSCELGFANSPSRTPSWSAVLRFWLSLRLPISREMGTLNPTMALSMLSM